MSKALVLLTVASLATLSAPAIASNRRCAATIAATDGGGLVTFIVRTSGLRWWAQYFAQANPS